MDKIDATRFVRLNGDEAVLLEFFEPVADDIIRGNITGFFDLAVFGAEMMFVDVITDEVVDEPVAGRTF